MHITSLFVVLVSDSLLNFVQVSLQDSACDPRFLQCANGFCMLKDFLCDGDNDCKDYSDEKHCGPTCPKTNHQCRSGRIIDKRWLCDGENDCHDNTDELNCTMVCLRPDFRCSAVEKCVQQALLCNGFDDCGDNSDEQNCGNTCESARYKCKNLNDIPSRWVCDGDNDCRDNSDESECVKQTTSTTVTTQAPTTVIEASPTTTMPTDTFSTERINPTTLTTRITEPPSSMQDTDAAIVTTESVNSSEPIAGGTSFYNRSAVPYCVENYCQNGGLCKIVDLTTTCRCPVEYEGERCEVKANQGSGISQSLVISISVVAVILVLVAIGVCFYQNMFASIAARTTGIVVLFHRLRHKDKKLLTAENDDI